MRFKQTLKYDLDNLSKSIWITLLISGGVVFLIAVATNIISSKYTYYIASYLVSAIAIIFTLVMSCFFYKKNLKITIANSVSRKTAHESLIVITLIYDIFCALLYTVLNFYLQHSFNFQSCEYWGTDISTHLMEHLQDGLVLFEVLILFSAFAHLFCTFKYYFSKNIFAGISITGGFILYFIIVNLDFMKTNYIDVLVYSFIILGLASGVVVYILFRKLSYVRVIEEN